MTPQRYTMEELARISAEEMVRRQFNLRNLGWMPVLQASSAGRIGPVPFRAA